MYIKKIKSCNITILALKFLDTRNKILKLNLLSWKTGKITMHWILITNFVVSYRFENISWLQNMAEYTNYIAILCLPSIQNKTLHLFLFCHKKETLGQLWKYKFQFWIAFFSWQSKTISLIYWSQLNTRHLSRFFLLLSASKPKCNFGHWSKMTLKSSSYLLPKFSRVPLTIVCTNKGN